MNTIKTAAATVTGARHARAARNGQDAAATWRELGAAVVVVCDGCSAGASSEVGARLGAALFAGAVGARLRAGGSPDDPTLWHAARTEVVRSLADLLERMPGDRSDAIREHFLFTIVAAAMTRDASAVWALGDGAYALDGATRELGPFPDNQPPYLAYDLTGDAADAHFEVATARSIVVATDGASDLATDLAFVSRGGLAQFAARTFVDHPDALRRHLAVLARAGERIDWDERRVVRTPAVLQDDCAIGVLAREDAS
ncbi:MAG: hypothetical protein HOV81_18925 [Kofleriaceae bacterium]|nr:hypothetical protein [Kofleriaceae bacterium]